jgi:Cache domain.
MTNKNFKLYFIGYFILFGIVITLISSLINYKLHLIEIENSIKKYAQEVSSSRINYILKPHIDKMDDIVSAIAHDKTLIDFIQTKNSAKEPELQNLFLTMTLAHKSIMHARLLDADGNEVIRVNRANEQSLPYISKDSQLQDKSLREYFEIVSKMTTQQIWHSKLNLNIENGKLEVPYSPTIRIAMPLFKENKFAGMVICNIHSNQLIDSIEDSPLFNLYIIDKDGYYILHPDRKYSWNKYTGVKRDLYEDFAQEAASILAKRQQAEIFMLMHWMIY